MCVMTFWRHHDVNFINMKLVWDSLSKHICLNYEILNIIPFQNNNKQEQASKQNQDINSRGILILFTSRWYTVQAREIRNNSLHIDGICMLNQIFFVYFLKLYSINIFFEFGVLKQTHMAGYLEERTGIKI